MPDQFTYNRGDLSIIPGTNSAYNNAAAGNGGGGGGSTGGGGSSSGGGTNADVSVATPTPRLLSFSIKSSPNGASIFVDGIDTGFTTPYTISYLETELLTPKTVTVINGSNTSLETYIIYSDVIKIVSDGNDTNNDEYDNEYGGGYSGGGSGGTGSGGLDSQVISDNEPFTPERVNYGKPREAQK